MINPVQLFESLKRRRYLLIISCLSVFLTMNIALVFLLYVTVFNPSKQVISALIPQPAKDVVEGILNIPYLHYRFEDSDIPHYHLQISEDDISKMISALPTSGDQLLTSERQEDANAMFNDGRSLKKVRVSFRGDMARHWLFEKKSWSIEFEDDEYFQGKKEFKLIVPFDRAYIGEALNSYRARKLGLFTPDDKFVTLQVNNGPVALYYQQESWEDEFLIDTFGTVEGNLYGEKSLEDNIFDSSFYWKKYVSIKGEENDFSDLDYLLNLINNSDDQNFNSKIREVLDIDTFLSWNVHSLLAGSIHQDRYHNARMFFNNEVEKFFMIPWDVNIIDYKTLLEFPEFSNNEEFYDLDYNYNPLVNRILDIPEFRHERNKLLWQYVSDENNLSDDLSFYDTTLKTISPALYSDTLKVPKNRLTESDIKRYRSILVSNINVLKQQLDRARLGVTVVQQEQKSIVPIQLDLSYRSASLVQLDSIVIQASSTTQLVPLKLYEDSNHSGTFDKNDRFITNLEYTGSMYHNHDLEVQLHSNREYSLNEAGPVHVVDTIGTLFIVSPYETKISISSFYLKAHNGVTGSLINPEIHVQTSRI